jgi:hypothetical protein
VLSNPVLYWGFALVAFVCELGLLAGAVTLAWRVGRPSGAVAGVLAALLVLAVVVVLWAVFMAPDATQRLPVWPRATIAGVACVAVGSGLIVAGLRTPGIVLIVAGPLLFAGQAVMEFGGGE